MYVKLTHFYGSTEVKVIYAAPFKTDYNCKPFQLEVKAMDSRCAPPLTELKGHAEDIALEVAALYSHIYDNDW